MEKKELTEVLSEHKKWLADNSTGKKANLRSADLWSADLGSADLQDANLRDANLRSANLRDASLRSANLSSADLRSADLRNADLWDADLWDAELRHTNFYKTAIRIKSLSTYLSFRFVSSYYTYSAEQQCDLINNLLEHVYMCNIGE